MRNLICVIVFVAGVGFSGCVWSIGGPTADPGLEQGRYRDGSPTLGKELLDLHRAREEGALTREEYRQIRKQLLSRYETDSDAESNSASEPEADDGTNSETDAGNTPDAE